MSDSRINEVAQELLDRSRLRKVGWEETRSENAYRVVFPDVSLRISKHTGGYSFDSGEDGYDLELTSDTGRLIGSIAPELDEQNYKILAEIFELAEQYIQDTGVSKALDYLKRS